MGRRRSFKSDTSFLENISIGAVGTQRVFEDLKLQGFKPIELERGSMGYKIWKDVKIKRIRVPDILCVNSGFRVESRAKRNLEITMSHSFSDPERGWDHGLNANDFVALVVCQSSGERPIDWLAEEMVQYVSVGDMRNALEMDLVVTERPKGALEGFESRITWPAKIARGSGTIVSVEDTKLQYLKAETGRKVTLKLETKKKLLNPLVQEGAEIVTNQILASVVPIYQMLPQTDEVSEDHYIRQLNSLNLSDRYASAKALVLFKSPSVMKALTEKLGDNTDDLYVRLEAAASLAKLRDPNGYTFIENCLADEYLERRLEAVIVLGEIGTRESTELLLNTLGDNSENPSIRAGAAWALGQIRDIAALDGLIACFGLVDEDIRIEAARALANFSTEFMEEVANKFSIASLDERHGIAWALGRSDGLNIQRLNELLVDDNARRWVAYIIGVQNQERYVKQIESLREYDPEVYFAVTVLWQIMSSWIYELEEYG